MSLRSALYLFARILGDLNAIKRGPTAIIKRMARKSILKKVGKATRWP